MAIEKKSIAKNSAYSLASTLVQKALTLGYFILVARVFGPEDQGKYSAALAFATLFGVLIDLGLSSALVRETAKNPGRAETYIGHMFVFRIVLSIVVYALMISVAVLAGYPEELVGLIALAGLATCIDVVATSCWSILRGFQNLLYEAIGGILAIVVMIVVGSVAILWQMPVWTLVLAVVLGSAVNFLYVLSLLALRARVKLSLRFDWKTARELALITAPFAAAALFSRIYTFSDTALLAKLAGATHAGYYAAANKLILALNMIPAAVSASIFPAMSSAFARGEATLPRTYGRAHMYLLLLALPMSAGIVLLSDQIVSLFYGASYAPTAQALLLLAPALLFGFVMFPIGALLAAMNRQHINTIIFGVGAVVNVAANVVLIPLIFSAGSAIAASLSSAVIFSLSFFVTFPQWRSEARFLYGSFFKIFVATCAMGLVLLWIRESVHVILSIFAGIGAYGLCVLFLKVIPAEDFEKVRSLMLKK